MTFQENIFLRWKIGLVGMLVGIVNGSRSFLSMHPLELHSWLETSMVYA